jgi:hypothetical protein
MTAPAPPLRPRTCRRLLPEEDAIGEPDDDEQDDTLPADLWY